MSENFPNMPGAMNLPDTHMKDPNHTAWDQWKDTPYEKRGGEQGGKTKIKHTDLSGPSGPARYNGGDIVNNKKRNTGTTLPVASPIQIRTSGDPNDTSATLGEF